MKAIAIEQFGGRDRLQLMDLPMPEVGPDDVLIRVRAAGVNPVDCKIREGRVPKRIPHEFPVILGWEAAGVIERTGASVRHLRPQDEVYACCRKPIVHGGTYAQYVSAPAHGVARKPRALDFREAAGVPLAALTAWQALDTIDLQAGQTILIQAGAGGVGHFAVQLARLRGAHVITTASLRNHGFVRELGASEVIDYRDENVIDIVRQSHPTGIDAAFDLLGGESLRRVVDVIRDHGKLVTIIELPEDQHFRQRKIEPHYVFVAPNGQQLAKLATMFDAGSLEVHLDGVFPLGKAADAHAKIEGRHVRGKLVLEVA